MSSPAGSSQTTGLRNSPLAPFYDVHALDPDSPMFVLKGIIASGISGTAIGAGAGLANNINPLAAGIQMGGRWFVVASAFFGSREYVVSPILLTLGATSSHERRYDELSAKQRGKLPARLPTLNEVRNDRVLDSALAAGLSFGGWSLLIRGAKVVPRATFTAALAASAAQYAVNFTREARLRFLSGFSSAEEPEAESTIPTLTEQLRQARDNPTVTMDVPGDETIPGRILNLMTYVAPLKKINPQEHMDTLVRERDRLDKKLREIEEEENKLFDYVQERSRKKLGHGGDSPGGKHVV